MVLVPWTPSGVGGRPQFLRVFNDFSPLDLNFLTFFMSLLSWPPLGRPLGAPWLPLGALWLPLGALCLPLAAPWLFVVAPLGSFGGPSAVFWLPLQPLGCLVCLLAALWPPLAVSGLSAPGRSWPTLAVPGRAWPSLAAFGRPWPLLATPGRR